MAQVGIAGDPLKGKEWKKKSIVDDPVLHSNQRGTITFATSGKNTRTTQIFFNFGNNGYLDQQGFAPFAEIIEGVDVLDLLYDGYGEGGRGDGSDGKGPSQGKIQQLGNTYLDEVFPQLSYIINATIVL
jgi:cyclophilin family peptidyl-prolyl cis-trans isomerase